MIHFQCPECRAPIEAPEDHAGRSARCPTCNRRLRVPDKERPDERPGQPLAEDATSTSSAVFRMDGRLYQARPRLEGTLIAAAAVVGLSIGMFVAVGLTVNVYSPWVWAGWAGVLFAVFGALLVVPAMYNIHRSGGRKTGRRLAFLTVGAAILLAMIYVLVAVLAPFVADRTPCYYRLQAVHRALAAYGVKHEGAFPGRPETLVSQGYLGSSKLTCREESGVREGTPTYLKESYDPRIDLKKEIPFPGDVMVLMERNPHRIVDKASGREVLARYALQLDGTVVYVAASDDPEQDRKGVNAALTIQRDIVNRVLAERATEQKARESESATPAAETGHADGAKKQAAGTPDEDTPSE